MTGGNPSELVIPIEDDKPSTWLERDQLFFSCPFIALSISSTILSMVVL